MRTFASALNEILLIKIKENFMDKNCKTSTANSSKGVIDGQLLHVKEI